MTETTFDRLVFEIAHPIPGTPPSVIATKARQLMALLCEPKGKTA